MLLKDFQRKSLLSNGKTPFVFGLEIFVKIDTASCLEMAEKLELYVEHQLNTSFYIVVDCETFFQTRT